MIESDIRKIEEVLQVSLPDFYRKTVLNYPFPVDSCAEEFLLQNDPEHIMECNRDPGAYSGSANPFVIGGDGGEEVYFIDLGSALSQVFSFDMETGQHVEIAGSWAEYLSDVNVVLQELEEDERAERERKASKKWWQLWR